LSVCSVIVQAPSRRALDAKARHAVRDDTILRQLKRDAAPRSLIATPQARQVADRFHLYADLRVAIEEQMSLSGRARGRALLPDKIIGNAQVDLIQDDPHVDATHRRRVRHGHRQSRQVVFETVHALRKKGLSCSAIARRTGYGRRSIAKWLTFETPPDRRKSVLKPTSPIKDGNRCGRHLYTISNSAVTSAVSRISSDFSQPGAAPRGRARTVRRRLLSYPINRLAMLSRCGIRRLAT